MINNNNKPRRFGIPAGEWLLRIIQGALVGGGAILPGISGGVLCVTFGIYQPIMALLSNPVQSFKANYKLYIPFLIGWLAGFLGLARIVLLLFETSSSLAICLFVGLISGTLPSLFRDAEKNGVRKVSWAGFALSLFISFSFLSFLKTGSALSIEPNIWWFFFCGVVWGLSIVVPGLSSSSILIFMGLYQPMTEGIASVSIYVVLPLLLGVALTAFLSARFVNYLFKNFYSLASHIILGVVIASTLLIVPVNFTGAADIVLSLVSFAIGFIIAIRMDKLGEKADKD